MKRIHEIKTRGDMAPIEPGTTIISGAGRQVAPVVWYTVNEVKRFVKSQGPKLIDPQWLTDQLNSAFEKGRQMQSERLKAAVRALSRDMHRTSLRPCETCDSVTHAMQESFGCVAYREMRKQSSKQRQYHTK